jgi:hypothetical protein
MKVFKNGNEPAGVILMRVGGHQYVDALNAAAPKIGRDDIFTGIQIRAALLPAAEAQDASTVDHHAAAFWKDHQ